MLVTPAVLEQIRLTIGRLPAETGGVLGGNAATGLVTDFYFDGTAGRTGVTYSPDTERVNRVLRQDWNPVGVDLLGFVHSHPRGFVRPSAGDLVYARTILAANPLRHSVLLPIVQSSSDTGQFELKPFTVLRRRMSLRVQSVRLEVADAIAAEAPGVFATMPRFSRVLGAYDMDRLEQSRVIAVGCGGAASFVEDLARAGVGEFVLIDPDVVTETNLATQQSYSSDIGRGKVVALAERIHDINPLAFVVACQRRLDQLSDTEFCWLARSTLRGRHEPRPLLCGMTDDFYAQARVNQLALKFELPSLCAQVYAEGRGAEVTFTHPDVTRACHRCILRTRYRAYLEEGFKNNVTSHATPFYATARLNALKQFVAMALLHHGTSHPRWGTALRRLDQRNLVQLRLDPDSSLPAFQRAIAGAETTWFFADDAVWVPQGRRNTENSEYPCPDCALETSGSSSTNGELST